MSGNMVEDSLLNQTTSSTGPREPAPHRLPGAFNAVETVMKLELLGRARSKKWIAAMVVWVILLTLMWIGMLAVYANFGSHNGMSPADLATALYQAKQWSFALMLLFTLGVSLAIAPALASTTINGDRETANLAILQATPITPSALLWGKLLAAWISGAVFVLVGAVPLAILVGTNQLGWVMFVKAVAVMLAEVFIVCAIGIGASALNSRPVASVLATYLLVGLLMIGGPLTFVFTANAMTERVEFDFHSMNYDGPSDPWSNPDYNQDSRYPGLNKDPGWKCEVEKSEKYLSHTNRTWWLLLSSPVAILSDAAIGTGPHNSSIEGSLHGVPGGNTMLGFLAGRIASQRLESPSGSEFLARAQDVKPPQLSVYDECYVGPDGKIELVPIREAAQLDNEVFGANYSKFLGQSWYWGMIFHAVLAASAIWLAWARLRVPVKRLPKGVRIA